MDLMAAVVALDSLGSTTPDRASVTAALRLVARLRRLVDAAELEWNLRLDELAETDPSISPEHLNAEATQRSLSAATTSMNRARAAAAVPTFADALASGSIGAEHLAAFVWAVRSLDERLRPQLLELQPELVRHACHATVEEFKERLQAEIRQIEGDDGRSRLRRQRGSISATAFTDRDGMWNVRGRFDPQRALALSEALRAMTERLFHAEHPDDTPSDPVLRHRFFQALALERLMLGGDGRGPGDPLFIVTIDHDTLTGGQRHARSRVDCGRVSEIPIETLLACTGNARFLPVLTDRDGVVVAMGRPVRTIGQILAGLDRHTDLDHGRSRRHASKHQQRALRAMYRRCGVHGCHTHVSNCEIHHIEPWEHGGRTDLINLIPLCRHHHDRLHAEGWQLVLGADRSLVIRRRGRVVMTTGPPSSQRA